MFDSMNVDSFQMSETARNKLLEISSLNSGNGKLSTMMRNIIKIQANIRGWLVRKRLIQIKKLLQESQEKG